MQDDLFAGYKLDGAWDEMFEAPEQPRPESFELYDALRALSPAEFEERCAERDRSLRDRGVTFALSGEELPFPLDVSPAPPAPPPLPVDASCDVLPASHDTA